MQFAPKHPVPVFPLPELVLFPHVALPLHVFELRYRTMVREALSGERLIAHGAAQAGLGARLPRQPGVLPARLPRALRGGRVASQRLLRPQGGRDLAGALRARRAGVSLPGRAGASRCPRSRTPRTIRWSSSRSVRCSRRLEPLARRRGRGAGRRSPASSESLRYEALVNTCACWPRRAGGEARAARARQRDRARPPRPRADGAPAPAPTRRAAPGGEQN